MESVRVEVKIEAKGAARPVKHVANIGEEGGLKLEIQPDANFLSNAKNIMVDLGSKVLKGSLDIGEMSLPAAMLGQHTRLELVSFEYSVLSLFLTSASKVSDPVERMRIICAGMVACATTAIQTTKGTPPIPAIKGDKLEGVDVSTNSRILVEHNSDKQDVTVVKLEGQDQCYVLQVEWENLIKFRGLNPSNVNGKKVRPSFVTFKGQDQPLVLSAAEYELDGTLSATKFFRMAGSAKIEDKANAITATITYLENPKKGLLSGLTGFFSKPAEIKPSDLNKVEIAITQGGKPVGKGSGHYTSFVEIDGKVYWRHSDTHPKWDFSHPSVTIKPLAKTQDIKRLISEKKFAEADV